MTPDQPDRSTPKRDTQGPHGQEKLTPSQAQRQQQAEQVFHNSEARLRSLFAEMPISLWEEDFSGVKQFIDDLTGLPLPPDLCVVLPVQGRMGYTHHC